MADGEGDYWEARRAPPSKIVMERRMQAANGMPPEQAVDTIGKLWCWDFLDGTEFASDQLRDAGRRYATLYWWRYGPVCAPAAGLDTTPISSGVMFRPNPSERDTRFDEESEAQFILRDAALDLCGRAVRRTVHIFAVDGMGDNDPAWLGQLISGYPAETAELNLKLAAAIEARKKARGRTPRRLAHAAEDDVRLRLKVLLKELRGRHVPYAALSMLKIGLAALATIDRRQGFHAMKRARKNPA